MRDRGAPRSFRTFLKSPSMARLRLRFSVVLAFLCGGAAVNFHAWWMLLLVAYWGLQAIFDTWTLKLFHRGGGEEGRRR